MKLKSYKNKSNLYYSLFDKDSENKNIVPNMVPRPGDIGNRFGNQMNAQEMVNQLNILGDDGYNVQAILNRIYSLDKECFNQLKARDDKISESSEKIRTIENERDALRDEISKLNKSLKNNASDLEISEISRIKTECANKIRQYQENLDSAENDIKGFKDDILNLEAERNSLRDQMNKDTAIDLDARIKNLENEVKKKNDLIEGFVIAERNKTKDYEQLSKQLENSKIKHVMIMTELETCQKTNRNLTSDIETCQNTNRNLTLDIDKLNVMCETFKKEKDEYKIQIEKQKVEFEVAIFTCKTKIDDLQHEGEELTKRYIERIDEINKLKVDHESALKFNQDAFESKLKTGIESAIKREKLTCQNELSGKDSTINKFRNIINQLNLQLQTSDRDVTSLRNQYDEFIKLAERIFEKINNDLKACQQQLSNNTLPIENTDIQIFMKDIQSRKQLLLNFEQTRPLLGGAIENGTTTTIVPQVRITSQPEQISLPSQGQIADSSSPEQQIIPSQGQITYYPMEGVESTSDETTSINQTTKRPKLRRSTRKTTSIELPNFSELGGYMFPQQTPSQSVLMDISPTTEDDMSMDIDDETRLIEQTVIPRRPQRQAAEKRL